MLQYINCLDTDSSQLTCLSLRHQHIFIMKGERKRQRVHFKPGHGDLTKDSGHAEKESAIPGCSWVDAGASEANRGQIINSQTTTDRKRPLGRVLTARRLKETEATVNMNAGMRMIDVEKMVTMWNRVIEEHLKTTVNCEMPHFAINSEHKWGLAWRYSLKCVNCRYVSEVYKLYKEVDSPKPGRNPAAVNLALQVGLQDCPVGNTRARLLFTSVDVPPPCRSTMQRTANTVGSKVTQLNRADMQKKVTLVKEHQRRSGQREDRIDVAVDGRYNSTIIASTKKPGQNASQAIAIACETTTDHKYIVSAVYQNKLCWTGAWLRGKGYDVTCPGEHEGCTANLNPHAPWSEFKMGKEIGTDLASQGTYVEHVTTDGDARSAAGVEEGIRMLQPLWTVTRLSDPTHLGRSQFKKCFNSKFSNSMFQGKTRAAKRTAHKVFSQDVKARCSLAFKELMKVHSGNLPKIRAALPKLLEATIRCYDGDCTNCRRNSMVCGGGVTNSWWERSMFLSVNKVTSVNMNNEDKALLREILRMKLSEQALERLKLNTDTQKCEAINRSLSVSLPKNVNYARNLAGRASSTIHRLNNGPEKSTQDKLSAVGASVSPRTKQTLHQMQIEQDYQKLYHTRASVRKRALQNSGKRLRDHLKYKNNNPNDKTDYLKGQLDNINPKDHKYSL